MIVGAVAMKTNVSIVEIRAVYSEAGKQVPHVIANGLRRKECFRELGTVIHANISVGVIEKLEWEIAKTDANHAANTGVGTVKIEGFGKSDVVA